LDEISLSDLSCTAASSLLSSTFSASLHPRDQEWLAGQQQSTDRCSWEGTTALRDDKESFLPSICHNNFVTTEWPLNNIGCFSKDESTQHTWIGLLFWLFLLRGLSR
jgi:hypothetical protein